jgi:hypothetical protein
LKGNSTLLSLEVPLRRSESPFKGIQEDHGGANLLFFDATNGGLLLRRFTFNRSTFKEVRVKRFQVESQTTIRPLKAFEKAFEMPLKGSQGPLKAFKGLKGL